MSQVLYIDMYFGILALQVVQLFEMKYKNNSFICRLDNLEEEIIEKKVRLIVLDSVASLVRKEYDNQSGQTLTERSNLLTQQAAILKYLAESFNIPVSTLVSYLSS